MVNLSDFSCVRFVQIYNLKISGDAFQVIKNTYPDILSIGTEKCVMDKNVSLGSLNCYYRDNHSTFFSLEALQDFSGRILDLNETHILHDNETTLHLFCEVLKLHNVFLDYERFFLTTSAPKVRRIEIHKKRKQDFLNPKDLLFISGFYNLEAISIDGMVETYDEIKKLERLRRVEGLLVTDGKILEEMKEKREYDCCQLKEKGYTQEQLKHYLMFQATVEQNKNLDFYHTLYVSRLERVNWENKIETNNLKKIREELMQISSMSRKQRRDISRENHEETFFDLHNDLSFDKITLEEDEYILVDTRPFSFDMEEEKGMQYYKKNNRIILDT